MWSNCANATSALSAMARWETVVCFLAVCEARLPVRKHMQRRGVWLRCNRGPTVRHQPAHQARRCGRGGEPARKGNRWEAGPAGKRAVPFQLVLGINWRHQDFLQRGEDG